MVLLLLLGAALVVAGGVFLWIAARARRRAPLLPGRIVYADTGDWRPPDKPLTSQRYCLTGKPDYLVETASGVIPVEIKSGRTPTQPYDSHCLQLAAYCLLVEETTGWRPPYGLICYPAATFRLEYTPAVRDRLIGTLAAMQADLNASAAPYGTTDPRRCAHCGYREACEEVGQR
jgi:CRISPR-associated exonuclease Cas4